MDDEQVRRPAADQRRRLQGHGLLCGGCERCHGARIAPNHAGLKRVWASGLSNARIAQHLHVSIDTVKTHLRRIFRKLGVASRTQAMLSVAPPVQTSSVQGSWSSAGTHAPLLLLVEDVVVVVPPIPPLPPVPPVVETRPRAWSRRQSRARATVRRSHLKFRPDRSSGHSTLHGTQVLTSTLTTLPPGSVTARSGLPSPSRSAAATAAGSTPAP